MNYPDPIWQASWISSHLIGGPRSTVPAPYLRKEFELPDGPVRKAWLHITALGLYVAEINGQRVGDHQFAPGWTDYNKRVAFQTYDVSSLLKAGTNSIGAILGDGWYCGHVGPLDRQFYGKKPELLAQLEVELEDGSNQTIVTDGSWKTATGPILANDLLMGEAYDARRELRDWSQPGYDSADWLPVQVGSGKEVEIERTTIPPVRCIEELQPINTCKTGDEWNPGRDRLYDFGQNLVGWVRLTVKGATGSTFHLRFGEILDDTGRLYTENLRSARATDFYTCKGGGVEEVWEPFFTFHGFRYLQIETGAKDYEIIKVEAVVLHSDLRPTGSFRCSHDLLNQLQQNIVWGQKGNFLEAPTDCPQRDERMGWTGDAQVFIRTACFNMDVQGFFHKWLRDMRDAQGPEGQIPPVVPSLSNYGARGGPAWADACLICPWTIYLCYNDTQVLRDHWECMERYMDFLAGHQVKNHICSHPDVDSWGGFGDWLALDGSEGRRGATPKDLIGTAFYANNARIMAETAALLGKPEEERKYRQLHGEIVEAFRARFTTADGLVIGGTQTACVLALHFDLLPEANRAEATEQLVADIKKRGMHLSTGFVGTPYLLDVLEKQGRLDVAYALLEQDTCPSWLFPVKHGATTVWEHWDGWTPEKGPQNPSMNSYNHYAYGAVGDWLYHTVAGLELDPQEPGYQHIIFRPRPGGSITWAEAELESERGKVRIHWELQENDRKLKVTMHVPEGARATFDPPAGWGGATPEELSAGTHERMLQK